MFFVHGFKKLVDLNGHYLTNIMPVIFERKVRENIFKLMLNILF